MALIESITNLETYKTYMNEIGVSPSYKIKQSFSCGLPGVWLYMKSIGLEDVYFDVIHKAKKQSRWFKELFYLLKLSNSNNQFYPKITNDLLIEEIPANVLDAQIPLAKPDFEMVFAFTREQLKETLEAIALPNKMIRIGNQAKSVGVMYSDETYYMYHADNPAALGFKTVDRCVEAIMRAMA